MHDFLAVAVVIATVMGPIAAVLISIWLDHRRQRRARRMDVFRSLMRTRRATLSIEHVSAINMVEIEFYGVIPVEAEFKRLMEMIDRHQPTQEWAEGYRDQLTRLLSTMATELGYSIAQLDVLRGGYYPQAFWEVEQHQLRALKGAAEVLSGDRPLKVEATQQ